MQLTNTVLGLHITWSCTWNYK